MFKLHNGFDRAIFRPAALGYRDAVPKPVRKGIRHLLSNLSEPIVFLNDLLQLRPKRAAQTFARFFINSTAGIGGVLDVAKTARLPHHDNNFGTTLAHYGVGPGPYLFLPFLGPTTLRDFVGGQGEDFILPLVLGNPLDRLEFQLPRGVLAGLDLRAESDAQLKALLNSAADPYATLRSVYLQARASEVRGNRAHGDEALPLPALDDPLTDPGAAPETPAPGETPKADMLPDQPPAGAPATAPTPAPPPPAEPATTPPNYFGA